MAATLDEQLRMTQTKGRLNGCQVVKIVKNSLK